MKIKSLHNETKIEIQQPTKRIHPVNDGTFVLVFALYCLIISKQTRLISKKNKKKKQKKKIPKKEINNFTKFFFAKNK